MLPEVPTSVMPLPEGYYFNIKPAPKHSIYRSVVQVIKTHRPFSVVVAEMGYFDPKDWELIANTLSNEVWAWYDRKENRDD